MFFPIFYSLSLKIQEISIVFSTKRCVTLIKISYGSVVPVSTRDPTKFQHQGFGTLLMQEAERIAREEHGSRKIAVISGNILKESLQIHLIC